MAPGILVNDSEYLYNDPITSDYQTHNPPSLALRSTCMDRKNESTPKSHTPKIAKLDLKAYHNDQDLANDIIKSLKISGGCIIRNMIPKDSLSAMEKDIRPHFNATRRGDDKREDFVPSNTRMVTGLMSKSRTYALDIVGNSVWQAVGEHFLTSRLQNSWHGDKVRTSFSKPQLSTTVAFSISPGTNAQGLHRDDDIYHTYHPAAREHHIGRDDMVCFFVAGKKCTKRNGATRFLPGSHLWDFSIPPPSDLNSDQLSYAELDPGDAFMMLGGCYHGAGANVTADEERLLYASFTTRGYLRQEENQYLANDPQRIRELPLWLQRFAGYGVSKPYMGWVEMKEPIRVLNPDLEIVDEEDFW